MLQINSTLNTGSTGRIAESIGIKVIENGCESFIAYGRSANNSKSQAIKIGNSWDKAFHLLNTRFFDSHGFHSNNATEQLINKINNIKPDIIHLHNLHGYYLNIQILFDFLKEWNKPVVWTLHDCWAFTGHCSHFDDFDCLKWKTHCGSCPKKNKYPASFFIDNSNANYFKKRELFTSIKNLTIVTVSDWMTGLVRQSFFKKNSIITVRNGVDTTRFKYKMNNAKIRKKYAIFDRFMIISVSSSWSPTKGLSDLIELSSILSADEVLVLVGLNSLKLGRKSNSIIAIPRTESIEELIALYSAADLLAGASYLESFGMTIIEALACGTPSIVYNRTALSELVDNSTIFPVEPRDYLAIKAIIQKIKDDRDGGLMQICRDRALKHFDSKTQLNDYYEIYKSILTKSN